MTLYQGSCHCGSVSFETELDIGKVIACNCSMCGRKGTLLSFVGESGFKLKSGEASLTDYLFGEKTIHHPFCKTCGVTCFGHGMAPDGKKTFAVNVRCLEGVDSFSVKAEQFDGKKL